MTAHWMLTIVAFCQEFPLRAAVLLVVIPTAVVTLVLFDGTWTHVFVCVGIGLGLGLCGWFGAKLAKWSM